MELHAVYHLSLDLVVRGILEYTQILGTYQSNHTRCPQRTTHEEHLGLLLDYLSSHPKISRIQ